MQCNELLHLSVLASNLLEGILRCYGSIHVSGGGSFFWWRLRGRRRCRVWGWKPWDRGLERWVVARRVLMSFSVARPYLLLSFSYFGIVRTDHFLRPNSGWPLRSRSHYKNQRSSRWGSSTRLKKVFPAKDIPVCLPAGLALTWETNPWAVRFPRLTKKRKKRKRNMLFGEFKSKTYIVN